MTNVKGMEMSDGNPNELRELDHRTGDGVEVRLLWRPADDALVVTVSDESRGGSFELPVAPGEAREVFLHPFAYAAFRGIAVDGDEREPEPALR